MQRGPFVVIGEDPLRARGGVAPGPAGSASDRAPARGRLVGGLTTTGDAAGRRLALRSRWPPLRVGGRRLSRWVERLLGDDLLASAGAAQRGPARGPALPLSARGRRPRAQPGRGRERPRAGGLRAGAPGAQAVSPRRGDVRGLGDGPLRAAALRSLLRPVHREALGHPRGPHLVGLGGRADLAPRPGRRRAAPRQAAPRADAHVRAALPVPAPRGMECSSTASSRPEIARLGGEVRTGVHDDRPRGPEGQSPCGRARRHRSRRGAHPGGRAALDRPAARPRARAPARPARRARAGRGRPTFPRAHAPQPDARARGRLRTARGCTSPRAALRDVAHPGAPAPQRRDGAAGP